VSATRIDEAMQAADGGASDSWVVPEKLDLNDITAAEKLVAVEHRLLKIGLRVDENPADGSNYEDLQLPMSVADQRRNYRQNEDIFDAPDTPQSISPNKGTPGDTGRGPFELGPGSGEGGGEFWVDDDGEGYEEDGGGEEAEHEEHMRRMGRLSFHLSEHGDDERGRDSKDVQPPYAEGSPLTATERHRKQSVAQHRHDKYGDADTKNTFSVR
jgi:hypothetical protein